MLLWEYLYWTDFTIPVEPINWEISREAKVRMTHCVCVACSTEVLCCRL